MSMVEDSSTTSSSTASPSPGCCAWRKRKKYIQLTDASNCCFVAQTRRAEEEELLVNELWHKSLLDHRAGSEKPGRHPSKQYLRNSFRYYGIALQNPQDYYNFLERLNKLYEKPANYSSTILPAVPVVYNCGQQGDKHKNGALLLSNQHGREKHSRKARSSERKSSRDGFGKEGLQPPNKFSLCSQTANCSSGDWNEQEEVSTPLFGVVSVKLHRRNGVQLGLGVAGGADREIPPTISYLRPGFIAHRSDQLRVGERLLAVNGIKLVDLTHRQIMVLLRNAGPIVDLAVEYDLNASCFRRPLPTTTLQRCAEIGLEDEFDSNESSPRRQDLPPRGTPNTSLYGLTLRGGAYGPDIRKNRPITVVSIRPGGPAHREGRLRVGDRIVAINGVDVCNSTLSVAQNLLSHGLDTKGTPKSKGRVVQLTVEYDVSVLATLQKARGPLLLEIEKVPGVDFGLVLAIRRHHNTMSTNKTPKRSMSILVQGIVRASIADRCGAVQVGDQLLAVDGITLEFTNLAEVYQLLRSQCPLLRLEILPLVQRGDCELYKPIDRPPGQHPYSKHSTIVRLPNGSISPDGVRHKNRQLNSPADERADKTFVKQSHSPAARVSSTTSSSCSAPELQVRQHRRKVQQRSMGNNPAGCTRNLSSCHCSPSRPTGQLMCKSMTTHTSWPLERFPLLSGQGSVTGRFANAVGCSSIPSGQICHAETMEVVLHDKSPTQSLASVKPSWKTFGISLERVLDTEEGLEGADEGTSCASSTNALFIAHIERNSAADKCSVLQVGDRIISINDWFTANGSLEEANHVLSHCAGNAVALLVEFDVIESVLPSSGQIIVKLAKRGNNLGIVCKSETNCEKGEPVIISHIRTGSVAHRSGSIQAGDRIKAIDNIALDSCTVEESMRLLQRSGNVVKLCVIKGNLDEQELQDSQAVAANNSIIYSIELSRKSQPLGITIASGGGSSNPVVISQLAAGGLAERTGAMHIGDRIVAINGEELTGKKVAQVISLLQQSSDLVSIKLCRTMGPAEVPSGAWRCSLNNHTLSTIQSDSVSSDCSSNKLETPIKSVDSAVESLEDSSEGVGVHLAKLGLSKSSLPRPSTSHHYYSTHHHHNQVDVISGGSSEQAWDSGLSSAADTTATQPSAGTAGECCGCSGSIQNTPTTSGGKYSNQTSSHNSPSEGNNKKHEQDWMKILEALETVGEEEMLKKLEDSIMNYGGAATSHSTLQQQNRKAASPPRSLQFPPLSTTNFQNNNALLSRKYQQQQAPYSYPQVPARQISSPYSSNYSTLIQPSALLQQSTSSLLYRNSLQTPPLSTPARKTSTHPDYVTTQQLGCPIPNSGRFFQIRENNYEDRKGSGHSSLESKSCYCGHSLPPPMPSPKPSVQMVQSPRQGEDSPIPFITSPTPLEKEDCGRNDPGEIFSVSLNKEPGSRSFGFSVSDGNANENLGIFVNSVIAGSPADGFLRPYDRVLQVNGLSTQFLNCDLAVPLLATDHVELLLLRKYPSQSEHSRVQSPL